jgi:hypothetical protein
MVNILGRLGNPDLYADKAMAIRYRILAGAVFLLALANWLMFPHTLTQDDAERLEDYVGKTIRITADYSVMGAFNGIDFGHPISVSFSSMDPHPAYTSRITVTGALENLGTPDRPIYVINHAVWHWPPGPQQSNPTDYSDDPSVDHNRLEE